MLKLKIIYYFIEGLFRPKFKTRVQLLAYQQAKLQKHFTWLKQHSPFYKSLQDVDFQQLTLMNKAAMMEYFDLLNTQQISLEQAMRIAVAAETTRDFQETLGHGITVGLSSGTSGNKGIFLATENERAQWVAEVLRRVLPIKIGQQQRIAFFLRSNSTLYEAVRSNVFAFHFFDLQKPIETLIQDLNNLQAHILIAPPSALLEIAQAVEDQIIRSNFSKIISVAEVLEKDIQLRLEKIFKQKIHQVYQATEGFLGSTCAHGTLHLHEDLILFEKKYVDESRKAFYPIISDFSRRTQPMLRYELNDILHERNSPCPCGSILMAIDRIEGRSDDILDFDGIKIFPDFFRYAVLLASDDILNFQVIQKPHNQISIKLKINNEANFERISQAVEKRVANLLEERGVKQYSINSGLLKHDDFFNKFRRIKREQ
jgi:putative adenylate-forming enzyme